MSTNNPVAGLPPRESRRGEARDVGVAVTLNQLHSIDVVSQSFFVDIKLMVAWQDAAAAAAAPDQMWLPSVFLQNGEHSQCLPNSRISDAEQGRPRTAFVYAGTCFCPCDLHDFPFDSQRLEVRFRSQKNRATSKGIRAFVDFAAQGAGARRRLTVGSAIRMHEWEVRAVNAHFAHTDAAQSAKGESYASIAVQIDVGRRSAYHVWNVGLVMTAIVSLAPLGYKIDAVTAYGERLAHLMTLVLTAVAFKLVIQDRLPEVSYLTAMDKYFMACFGFLASLALSAFVVALAADGSLGEGVGVGSDDGGLAAEDRAEERAAWARALDRDIHYAWALLWCALHLSVAVFARRLELQRAPRQIGVDEFVAKSGRVAMVKGQGVAVARGTPSSRPSIATT